MQKNNPLLQGSLSAILLKLLSEQEKMYGYEMTKKVKELSGGSIALTEGALYPALHKLEADGLVDVSIERIDNRARKYYSLTKKGKKESQQKLAQFFQYLQQMQQLLNFKLNY